MSLVSAALAGKISMKATIQMGLEEEELQY